jgi:hypothetical protein
MDFITSYRVLGLDPECDWDCARQRYQQLVSRHHPDRTGPDADTATLAEINRAWRPLRHHYQTHGFMPLQTSNSPHTLVPVTPFKTPFQPARRRHYWAGMAAILVPAWVIIMNREQVLPPEPLPAIPTSPASLVIVDASEDMAPEGKLGAGDSLGHVIELLGPPDDTRGARWYYGASWIELRDGRVNDWYSSADHPLPADTLSRPARP